MKTKQLLLSIIFFISLNTWGQTQQKFDYLYVKNSESPIFYYCEDVDSTSNYSVLSYNINSKSTISVNVDYFNTTSNKTKRLVFKFSLTSSNPLDFKVPFEKEYDSCVLKIDTTGYKKLGYSAYNTSNICVRKYLSKIKYSVPEAFCRYNLAGISIPNKSNFYNISPININETITSDVNYDNDMTRVRFNYSNSNFGIVKDTLSIRISIPLNPNCSLTQKYPVKYVDYANMSNSTISIDTSFMPNCSNTVGKLVVNKPDTNYYYSIGVFRNSNQEFPEYLNRYKVSAKDSLKTLTIKNISIYDLSTTIYIGTSDGYCGYYNDNYVNWSFKNNTKVVATDILALINFVERYPDSYQVSWHDRGIYNDGSGKRVVTLNKDYASIRDWKTNNSYVFNGTTYYYQTDISRITCGKIVGLDLQAPNNFDQSTKKSTYNSISDGSPFVFPFDTLDQLRTLNISHNNFTGAFNHKNSEAFKNLQLLDISNNKFTDTSFADMKTALQNTSINASYNKLTYISLIPLMNEINTDGCGFLPQSPPAPLKTYRPEVGDKLIHENRMPQVPISEQSMIKYYWSKVIDGGPSSSAVSNQRDFVIYSVSSSDNGYYVCFAKYLGIDCERKDYIIVDSIQINVCELNREE